jgi:chromosome partitioning protein
VGPRVLGVVFQKGGSGKTTTAVNLAAAFALRRTPTLLIDLDPHAGATTALGGDPSLLTVTVKDALLAVDRGIPVPRDVFLTALDPLITVMPADVTLAQLELLLGTQAGSDLLLRRLVEAVSQPGRWPIVLIDGPPNLGLLSVNILMAATEIIVPVQAHYLPQVQLAQLFATFEQVRRRTGKDWARITIVPTMVEAATTVSAAALEFMGRDYRKYLSRSYIRKNTAIVKAQAQGKAVQWFDPRSPGAKDYEALADELLAKAGAAVTTEVSA